MAYDGYCGGKDLSVMQWDTEGVAAFQDACHKTSRNFVGKSIVCVPYGDFVHVTSPIPMCGAGDNAGAVLATSDLIIRDVKEFARAQFGAGAPNCARANSLTSRMMRSLVASSAPVLHMGMGELTCANSLYGTHTIDFPTKLRNVLWQASWKAATPSVSHCMTERSFPPQ